MALRPVLFFGSAGLCVLCAGLGLAASSVPTHAAPSGGIQPGAYRTTLTYSNVRGLPPAMAQHMMSRPHVSDGCLKTGDINAVVQDAMAAGSDMTCSQDHGSASGGVIRGVASCRDDRGTSGMLTILGTYTATHADVNADLDVKSSPLGPISEHIHLVSERTGSCP